MPTPKSKEMPDNLICHNIKHLSIPACLASKFNGDPTFKRGLITIVDFKDSD